MFKVTQDYSDKVFYIVSENDVAQEIIDNLDDEPYDEMLDECYGDIDICGISYSPSIALHRADPIAYNCGRYDYYDSIYSDIVYELERFDYGDTGYYYGYTVELIDDEEDEELA